MAIDLIIGGGGDGRPSVKLPNKGDRWVGMLIDFDPAMPRKEYGTGVIRKRPDGTDATQDALTILTMNGTKAHTGTAADGYTPLPEGVVVKAYIAGGRRWDFRQALKDLGRPPQVGDVILEEYIEDTMVGFNGARLTQPKHVHRYRVRAAKPEELELVQRCEQLHMEQRQSIGIPASAPAQAGPFDDEAPW